MNTLTINGGKCHKSLDGKHAVWERNSQATIVGKEEAREEREAIRFMHT